MERFRPYAAIPEDWLAEVGRKLSQRAADNEKAGADPTGAASRADV
jgi:hypothetical protein